MGRTDTLGNFLTDVATAIRNKKGTTDTIVASDFDTEIESIESGNSGDTSIEDGLITRTLTEYSNNIRFTTNHKDALRNANMIFICVDTPQGSDGSVNTTNFYNCLATIKESITNDVSIIIRSTVPVGTNKLTCDYFLDSSYKNLSIDELKVVSSFTLI